MTKLTSRDKKILWSCGVSQVLTTSQIQRWHFGSTSLRNVQKRLQKLVEAGFLNVIETRVCTDNVVLLGRVGQAELQKTGWKVELRKEAPKDLEHHLGVVDIRIALDRSLTILPGMQLRYCYAYWELGQFAWSYPIIPDMIFSLRNAHTLQAAVEFDRKTEPLGVFAQKLLQYRLLLHRHPLSTVMVVAEKDEDLERLVEGLEGVRSIIPILTTSLPDLKEKGLAAIARASAQMYGTRTIVEQLEIDTARLQIGETAVKGTF
jgi:Replication-relaxation